MSGQHSVTSGGRARYPRTGTTRVGFVHSRRARPGARSARAANLKRMDAPVAGLFSSGRGLVTRAQALGAGLPPRAVDRLVRVGEWVAVRRGVYALREHWEALDEYVGKPRLVGLAVHLTTASPHVLSHDNAAHELGLPILGRRGEPVHVTHEADTGGRLEHGVKHHTASYDVDDVVVVDGVPVLGMARTALDITREHGYLHGLCACDSALRAGVTRSELKAGFEKMWCWPGSTAIHMALSKADGRSESVAETLGRDLVDELGIGDVDVQFTLTDGFRTVRCDLRVGRHVFEVDGRLKYRDEAAGGVARKPADEVLWEEKLRQDFVTGFKLGMSRIVWADFWQPQRTQALARLLREYRTTVDRFGTSIDDLSPYIVRAA